MAAGNFTFYNAGKLAQSTSNLASTSIAVALLTSAYTPSAAHATWADLSASECADADYAQKALSGAAYSGSAGTVTYDSADVSFGASVSITAKYAVFVVGTAGALTGTETVLGYVDLNSGGGSASSTNSVFSVNTPNGLFIAS